MPLAVYIYHQRGSDEDPVFSSRDFPFCFEWDSGKVFLEVLVAAAVSVSEDVWTDEGIHYIQPQNVIDINQKITKTHWGLMLRYPQNNLFFLALNELECKTPDKHVQRCDATVHNLSTKIEASILIQRSKGWL